MCAIIKASFRKGSAPRHARYCLKEDRDDRDDLCRYACVSQHVRDLFSSEKHAGFMPQTAAQDAYSCVVPSWRTVRADAAFEACTLEHIICSSCCRMYRAAACRRRFRFYSDFHKRYAGFLIAQRCVCGHDAFVSSVHSAAAVQQRYRLSGRSYPLSAAVHANHLCLYPFMRSAVFRSSFTHAHRDSDDLCRRPVGSWQRCVRYGQSSDGRIHREACTDRADVLCPAASAAGRSRFLGRKRPRTLRDSAGVAREAAFVSLQQRGR